MDPSAAPYAPLPQAPAPAPRRRRAPKRKPASKGGPLGPAAILGSLLAALFH